MGVDWGTSAPEMERKARRENTWNTKNFNWLVMLQSFFSTAVKNDDVNLTRLWRHLHFYKMAHTYEYWYQ